MSQVSGFFTNSGPGGYVQTLTGNSGGPVHPTAGNINIITANSTPIFAGSGSTETLDFGLANLVLGSSLPALTSGTSNVGMGNGVFGALTSGIDNVGIGTLSSQMITSGEANTSVGYGAGREISTGINNTYVGAGAGAATTIGFSNSAFGTDALNNYTTGTSNAGSNTAIGDASLVQLSIGTLNTALGASSGDHLLTGTHNILIGYNAANTYTTSESSNIIIGNFGVVSESNVVRIGTSGTGAGQQSTCYIAGIDGVNVGSTAQVVTEVSGQLGSAVITAGSGITITPGANTITITASGGSGITTIDGDSGSATGSTITFNANTNAGATVKFAASGSTVDLDVTDANFNTFFGLNAGKSGNSTNQSSAFGNASLSSITSGNYNTALGQNNLFTLTTGIGNVGVGTDCLYTLLGGNHNIGIGLLNLFNLAGGSGNVCIGYQSGVNYTASESYNILIGDDVDGTVGESHVLRIGKSTGSGTSQLNKAFVAGINGATSTGTAVVINSSDQLTAGGIATNTSQPAFQAYASTSSTNSTGDGTVVIIPFDTIVFDQNGNFNTSTHTFTAPVTGRYMFNVAILYTGITTQTTTQIVVVTTGNSFNLAYQSGAGTVAAGGFLGGNGAVFAHMTSGDTAYFTASATGGPKTAGIDGGQTFVYCGGYLVS